ncbi:hypothetical protein [Flectobacillus major]|uniref:hypothetical protein n=1 Tax=Flectobacillus major TaxID=103 RepID=UPI0004007F62|nr:hypothetical protein [Flectobacillus major]
MKILDTFVKYEKYLAEDFVSDSFFLQWISEPNNPQISSFWQEFIKKFPQKNKEIETAKEIILQEIPDESLTNFEEDELWQRINKSISS